MEDYNTLGKHMKNALRKDPNFIDLASMTPAEKYNRLMELLDSMELVRGCAPDCSTEPMSIIVKDRDNELAAITIHKYINTNPGEDSRQILSFIKNSMREMEIETMTSNVIKLRGATRMDSNGLPSERLDIFIRYPAPHFYINTVEYHPSKLYLETPELYAKYTLKYINSEPASRYEWMTDIFRENPTTSSSILLDRHEYKVIHDITTFQDSKVKFHYLILFRDVSIKSIRDLCGSHLTMLETLKSDVKALMTGPPFNYTTEDYILMFHYYPTYYRLHIHILGLDSPYIDYIIGRSHNLDQVIYNIKQSSDYYQKVTIPVIVMSNNLIYLSMLNNHEFN